MHIIGKKYRKEQKMGSAPLMVKFKDGHFLFGCYDTVGDNALPYLSHTPFDCYSTWEYKCTPPEQPEEVEIFTAYANGFLWEGKACKTTGQITEGLNPYEDEERCKNIIPPWAKKIYDIYWKKYD